MTLAEVAPRPCVVCVPPAGTMEGVNNTVTNVFEEMGFRLLSSSAKELSEAEIECMLGGRREPGFSERSRQFIGSTMLFIFEIRIESNEFDELVSEALRVVRTKHGYHWEHSFNPLFIPAKDMLKRLLCFFRMQSAVATAAA